MSTSTRPAGGGHVLSGEEVGGQSGELTASARLLRACAALLELLQVEAPVGGGVAQHPQDPFPVALGGAEPGG